MRKKEEKKSVQSINDYCLIVVMDDFQNIHDLRDFTFFSGLISFFSDTSSIVAGKLGIGGVFMLSYLLIVNIHAHLFIMYNYLFTTLEQSQEL